MKYLGHQLRSIVPDPNDLRCEPYRMTESNPIYIYCTNPIYNATISVTHAMYMLISDQFGRWSTINGNSR